MDVRKKLALFTLRLSQDSDSRMSQLKLRRQKRMNIIRRRLDTIRRRQSIKRMQLYSANPCRSHRPFSLCASS